jgi:hypothetical protein
VGSRFPGLLEQPQRLLNMNVNADGVANSYLSVGAEGIRFETDSP